MVILGIDAHKRSHTVVAVDERGRKLGETTIKTTTADHLELLTWADRFGEQREWAVEDCRQLSRRLERDLLGAGEVIMRVPPKLMAHSRDAARTYGKSDPIDALAVARAALREPNLPKARLDGASRELRLLVDHREGLVGERTRAVNRLRWHLHELDPSFDPPARCLIRAKHLRLTSDFLNQHNCLVADLAQDLLVRIGELSTSIAKLDKEIADRVGRLAPSLLEIPGCGVHCAAKIVAETADIRRFRTNDAFARHNGTAPLPVWSGNRVRHRLARTGNRQLNVALHRIAITQAHYHEEARAYLERRRARGDTKPESIRVLKRRLSDVVYRALMADAVAGAEMVDLAA